MQTEDSSMHPRLSELELRLLGKHAKHPEKLRMHSEVVKNVTSGDSTDEKDKIILLGIVWIQVVFPDKHIEVFPINVDEDVTFQTIDKKQTIHIPTIPKPATKTKKAGKKKTKEEIEKDKQHAEEIKARDELVTHLNNLKKDEKAKAKKQQEDWSELSAADRHRLAPMIVALRGERPTTMYSNVENIAAKDMPPIYVMTSTTDCLVAFADHLGVHARQNATNMHPPRPGETIQVRLLVWVAYTSIYAGLIAALKARIPKYAKTITIVGHGMGAAIGRVVAYELISELKIRMEVPYVSVSLVTFGESLSGNADWVDWWKKTSEKHESYTAAEFNSKTNKYEVDPTTRLPASFVPIPSQLILQNHKYRKVQENKITKPVVPSSTPDLHSLDVYQKLLS